MTERHFASFMNAVRKSLLSHADFAVNNHIMWLILKFIIPYEYSWTHPFIVVIVTKEFSFGPIRSLNNNGPVWATYEEQFLKTEATHLNWDWVLRIRAINSLISSYMLHFRGLEVESVQSARKNSNRTCRKYLNLVLSKIRLNYKDGFAWRSILFSFMNSIFYLPDAANEPAVQDVIRYFQC